MTLGEIIMLLGAFEALAAVVVLGVMLAWRSRRVHLDLGSHAAQRVSSQSSMIRTFRSGRKVPGGGRRGGVRVGFRPEWAHGEASPRSGGDRGTGT